MGKGLRGREFALRALLTMNINGLGGKMTAVILAGGKSSRFGRDKSLLTVDGRLLLERSLDNWGSLFAEVIIVSESGGKFSFLKDVKETADIYRGRGPLGGVHAGLKLSSSPWSFVAACDMPHIDKELIAHLCAAVTEESKWCCHFITDISSRSADSITRTVWQQRKKCSRKTATVS